MPEPLASEPPPHTLDDVMIAMDVVDTIRHRDDLVRAELNDAGREAELIERLREIYRQQGIEVPDRVLEEGVKALKDSRFTWTPPPPSWKRTLFQWWTMRRRMGGFAAVALAALLTTCGVRYLIVDRPAEIAENRIRVELTETLPNAVRRAHADIVAAATEPKAKTEADRILADANRAARDKDRAALEKTRKQLEDLRTELLSEYTLTIVSRPGEKTGIWRRPPRSTGSNARNYYLIVEAVSPDGRILKLPIRNEEDGRTSLASAFGVRVPKETWDAVSADKSNDGIVQNNRFGTKLRGKLTIDYAMPFAGGMITRW